ncbi:hypothetical protein CC85DRAFT_46189 [Cutaneotrichosporon oleaginosum]|uniref:Uncharacterized protein n=1 Tax=Cutaneotrichosporon oleaginosum TaxID=879819 RepID=A0A0J1B7E7_9TREE|nr:uncharacterized protein CC85DRAFT_46189 [Cutaneotrichosporon oleaginosum]KLT43654.1 hypothetical protein CC85DRAFT_46189 [Cutaneotrichosporon oleaginosum]TXT12680.1 hypothetical protein COLE_03090 [Cutaneotrichosporon oleaginosum]
MRRVDASSKVPQTPSLRCLSHISASGHPTYHSDRRVAGLIAPPVRFHHDVPTHLGPTPQPSPDICLLHKSTPNSRNPTDHLRISRSHDLSRSCVGQNRPPGVRPPTEAVQTDDQVSD